MRLIPILVGVVNVYDGITCSLTPFQGLEPINEVHKVLVHIKLNAKIARNMANSADPDKTPHFAASHLGLPFCKCFLFRFVCINALITSPQLRTLNCRHRGVPTWCHFIQ